MDNIGLRNYKFYDYKYEAKIDNHESDLMSEKSTVDIYYDNAELSSDFSFHLLTRKTESEIRQISWTEHYRHVKLFDKNKPNWQQKKWKTNTNVLLYQIYLIATNSMGQNYWFLHKLKNEWKKENFKIDHALLCACAIL